MLKPGNFLKTQNSFLHCVIYPELLSTTLAIKLKYIAFSFEKREIWLKQKCTSHFRYVNSSELVIYDLVLQDMRTALLNKFNMELNK